MAGRLAVAAAWAVALAAAIDYDQERATQFANLAGAAYCSDTSLKSWSCGPKCIPGVTNVNVCHGSTTKAFLAKWEDQCLVSFQGTSELDAWFTNLRISKTSTKWGICGDCRVHDGFLNEWKSLQGCVMELLPSMGCPVGSQVRTTGHSLGAALNGLAMLDLQANGWHITESYDFGMPRTGDEGFASTFNRLFGEISFRVTHRKDPVPQVPPDQWVAYNWHFLHKEPEVFYDEDATDGFMICQSAGDKTCSLRYWDLATDLSNIADHLNYMGVSTGRAGCVDAANATSQALVV